MATGDGTSAAEIRDIARHLGVEPRTVRALVRRWQREAAAQEMSRNVNGGGEDGDGGKVDNENAERDA